MDSVFRRIIWLLRKTVIKRKEKLMFLGGGADYGRKFLPLGLKLTGSDICISAGAGEDISFECELAKRYPCTIMVMDPTPRAIAHYKKLCEMTAKGEKLNIDNDEESFYEITEDALKKIAYFEYGLSGESKKKKFYYPENSEWVSCSEFSETKGHFFVSDCFSYLDFLQYHHIDPENVKILKLDIEGSEYEVIRNVINNNILPDILLFEIHKLPKYSLYYLFSLLWSLKKANMSLVMIKGYDFLYIKT